MVWWYEGKDRTIVPSKHREEWGWKNNGEWDPKMKMKIITKTTYLFLRLPNNSERNKRTNLPNPLQPRINQVILLLARRQRIRQPQTRRLDHTVRHRLRLAQDRAEAHAGEDVHVVALAGVEHLSVEGFFGEGRAGGEEDGALGPFDGVVEFAFGEAHGVGEGEDYWAGVEGCHCLDDGLVEGILKMV